MSAKKFKSNKKTVAEKSMAKVARKVVKSALKTNIQDKYQLFGWALTPDNNGIVNAICAPSNGTTDVTRVGDLIRLQECELSFTHYAGLLALVAQEYTIRHILFIWHPSDGVGAPPNASNILAPVSLGTARAPHAPYKFEQRKQFTVLYDTFARVPLNNSNGSLVVRKNVGCKNIATDFEAGSVLGSNRIYHLSISDTSLANSPTVYGTTRVTYKDA